MCGCSQNSTLLAAGVDGYNAYTLTTAAFTQPATGNTVTINVSNAGQYTGSWAYPSQLIFIQSAGYFEVISSTPTTITCRYKSDYASFNQALTAAGNTVATNKGVSPAGIKGATGANGTDAEIEYYFNYALFTSSRDNKVVTSATPVSAFRMIYPGSNNFPLGVTLTSIVVNAWVVNKGASGTITVRDVTNSLDIATDTGITSTSNGNLISLTITPANLSTAQAVWEFRMNAILGGGASEFAIASIQLYYS